MTPYTAALPALVPLLLLFSIVPPARSQNTMEGAPRISRTCLWNADRTTWSALHLRRWQIGELERLRTEFPAVVDGQWIITPEQEIADLALPEDRPLAGDPLLTTTEQAAPAEGQAGMKSGVRAGASPGLQQRLRSILSEEQLGQWGRLCR